MSSRSGPTALRTGWLSQRLFVANLAGSGMSLATALVLAERLGADHYGAYASALAILMYLAIFADFGLLATCARLLAGTTGDESRGLEGVAWRVFLGGCLVMSALTLVVALGAESLFAPEVSSTLLAAAPLAGAALGGYFLEQLLKAVGRTGLLAVATVLSRALLLGLAFVVTTPRMAVVAYLVAGLLAVLVVAAVTRPMGRRLGTATAAVKEGYRAFGLALTAGRVPSLLAYRLDMVLLAILVPLNEVASYALTLAIMNVVVVLSQSGATTRFRSFHGTGLPGAFVRRNAVTAAALAIVVVGFGWLLVARVLGDDYDTMSVLLPLVAVASFLQAAYQPFNSWLLANGHGRRLRNLLLVVTAVNLVANLALIPTFGSVGAAVASIAGNGTYLLLARRAYREEAGNVLR